MTTDLFITSKQQAATDTKTADKTEASTESSTTTEEKDKPAAPASAGLNGPKSVLESVTNPTDKDDKVHVCLIYACICEVCTFVYVAYAVYDGIARQTLLIFLLVVSPHTLTILHNEPPMLYVDRQALSNSFHAHKQVINHQYITYL